MPHAQTLIPDSETRPQGGCSQTARAQDRDRSDQEDLPASSVRLRSEPVDARRRGAVCHAKGSPAENVGCGKESGQSQDEEILGEEKIADQD